MRKVTFDSVWKMGLVFNPSFASPKEIEMQTLFNGKILILRDISFNGRTFRSLSL
jgi:hypothetical protein